MEYVLQLIFFKNCYLNRELTEILTLINIKNYIESKM